MQTLRRDGHAPGEVVRGPGEVVAALVAAPVEKRVGHLHATPELRAVLTVHRAQHVIRAHGGAHADVCGLVAEAGGIGAELAGALEVDGLGVEGAYQGHEPVHLHQFRGVPGEFGQGAGRAPLRIEKLVILNLEFGNCLQTAPLARRAIIGPLTVRGRGWLGR